MVFLQALLQLVRRFSLPLAVLMATISGIGCIGRAILSGWRRTDMRDIYIYIEPLHTVDERNPASPWMVETL